MKTGSWYSTLWAIVLIAFLSMKRIDANTHCISLVICSGIGLIVNSLNNKK